MDYLAMQLPCNNATSFCHFIEIWNEQDKMVYLKIKKSHKSTLPFAFVRFSLKIEMRDSTLFLEFDMFNLFNSLWEYFLMSCPSKVYFVSSKFSACPFSFVPQLNYDPTLFISICDMVFPQSS